MEKNITLALGGGGSKGNVHIGVLRRLEQEGFKIRAVAGTSFGGLIAAFYALGYTPDEIEEMFANFYQSSWYGRLSRGEPSFIGFAGVVKWLEVHIGSRTFADVKIPYTVTAVDLNSGRQINLSEGSLLYSILATIAVPGIFPAQRIGEWELVDGGTLDPVPVAPARALAPKLPVVAVSLNMPIGETAQSRTIPGVDAVPHSIAKRLSRSRYARAMDVVLRSVDIMMRAVAEYRLAIDKPDVIIRPKVADIEILARVDVSEVVKRGEAAVDEVLPELKQLFAWHNRAARSLKFWG
ncbi:MAG: patatin-like phospholipase family protein [Anaerolineales bacterium]|nr:MAG: patatin-like phospholipase family protein [Anaerolineales bacterium]